MRHKQTTMGMALIAALLFAVAAGAATWYVDAAANYNIAATAGAWSAVGVTRPNVEYRFSTGTAWDSSGGYVDNYGTTSLVAGLVIGSSGGRNPFIVGGAAAPHCSAVMFANAGTAADTATIQMSSAQDNDVTTNSFAIEIWLILVEGTNTETLIAKRTGAGNNGWAITTATKAAGNDINWRMRVSGVNYDATTGDLAADPDFSHERAYHLIVDRDASQNPDLCSIYLNNVLMDTAAIPDGSNLTNSGTIKFTIGAYSNIAAATCSNDGISLFRFWNTLLTEDERDSLFAHYPTGTAAMPFPTIQAGIAMAIDDDTILVSPGTYQEVVVTTHANVILASNTANRPLINGINLPSFAFDSVGVRAHAETEIGYFDIANYDIGGYMDGGVNGLSTWHHCTFYRDSIAVVIEGVVPDDSLMGCTLDGTDYAGDVGLRVIRGAAGAGTNIYIHNNIFISFAQAIDTVKTGGSNGQTLNYSNNNFWNNTADYDGQAAGSGDLERNPRFKSGTYIPTNALLRNSGLAWYGETPPTPMGAWDVQLLPAGIPGAWALSSKRWARDVRGK